LSVPPNQRFCGIQLCDIIHDIDLVAGLAGVTSWARYVIYFTISLILWFILGFIMGLVLGLFPVWLRGLFWIWPGICGVGFIGYFRLPVLLFRDPFVVL
jgi:hypothetical protein